MHYKKNVKAKYNSTTNLIFTGFLILGRFVSNPPKYTISLRNILTFITLIGNAEFETEYPSEECFDGNIKTQLAPENLGEITQYLYF